VANSLIGTTLGHYRITDQLGAGGMGVVYRAYDMRLGRQVAIKVLPATDAANADAVERFRREARTASALNHPNICTIYGFDEQAGECYLAMELLDGEPLDQRLTTTGPLDVRAMLDIGVQVAEALDAAHNEGILHRDIKPANIFLTRRGQVKVLDFGLAKLTTERRQSQPGDGFETRAEHFSSAVGTTVGTIAYMSPEQARGEDLDPRTDLFSFGVVLYEMSTGRQSFPGHTTAVVFDGILNREPLPPSTFNHSLPADLDRIIARALEKDRELRYQTAADLRADLQRLRRDSGSRRMSIGSDVTDVGSALRAAPPSATAIMAASSPARPSAQPQAVAPPPPIATPLPSPVLPAAIAPPARGSSLFGLGVTGLAVLVLGAAFVVMARRPADSTPTGSARPASTAAAPAGAAADGAAPPPGVDPAPATPVASTETPSPAPATTTAPLPTASAASPPKRPAKAPAAAKVPVAASEAPAPAAGKDAEARERLDVAQAKLRSNLVDQAVADLRQILLDYPGSPVAADAAFLAAEALEKAGRSDDAMAVYVEFDRRFAGNPRVAQSKWRRAQLLQAAKAQPRQAEGYQLLGEIARDFPGTAESRAALQAKRQFELPRKQLKGVDPVLGIEVPALLLTLRMIADQFPGEVQTMVALNQLASAYQDMDQYEVAAEVWEHLAAQYPGNPVEVWFRLGELYERRLRNPEKARAAYEKVPPDSPRYRDAQQRLKRR
jgi:serine/threonine protein kinase/tetratricopeptide (TPR) repeat protein